MRNMWDVMRRMVSGEPLSEDEQKAAHALIDAHQAQHLGIAAQLGEHDFDIQRLKDHTVLPGKPPGT